MIHNRIFLLLEHKPTHRHGHLGDPLQAAAFVGNKECVKMLLQYPKTNVDTDSGILGTALQAAAYHGLFRILTLLLSNEEDTKPAKVQNADDVFRLHFLANATTHEK